MKATKCNVPGCKTMVPRKDMRTHLYDASKSHYDLQHGERQRLLAVIKAKENDREVVKEKEEMVLSFTWQIVNFHAHFAALMEESSDPLTSGQYRQHGYTWRAILTKELNLFLQLSSATFPATVEIRMVLSPGNENEAVFVLQPTTLKEGEMWGRKLSNLNKWVDGDGNISVVYYLLCTFDFTNAFYIFELYVWYKSVIF